MSNGIRAPELDAGLGWLNTDRPLRIQGELRGQVVVLDFWTYCCINCIHILPDLAYLEHKYGDEPVTFIGVHSAKFTNEASRETIRAAILRYEIQHPVVIDDDMKIWRSYTVRSWPTVVVIDASGCVISTAAGEGNREVIDQAIAQALEQGRAVSQGTLKCLGERSLRTALAAGPLALRKEASVRAASGLAFPGKVLADAESKRLFVADSNHNRVLIAELPDSNGNARVIRVVGSGRVGAEDGTSDRASFHHPQGVAAGHGNLYIADTENHLIRRIDLESFEVTTIVGTGKMDNDRAGGGKGTQQGLNSPWDLVLEGMTLYVAMAGVHQIWRIDLPIGFARALAGSGRENLVDGPAETAALAQPSGICSLGGNLYFADSEVSAIRGIDMTAERVFTVIGEGLFSFGDVDGTHPMAKLQHPLGVAASAKAPLSALASDQCAQPSLLVADTYNHKIKAIDPGRRSVRTLYGTGSPGASTPDGKVAFFEPGGLSVAGDDLYVADTNNHRVVRINLASGTWQEIVFDGLSTPSTLDSAIGDTIRLDPVLIAAGRDIDLVLDIQLPSNAHLNDEAPWSVRVTSNGTTLVQRTGKSDAMPLIVRIPVSSVATENPWEVVAAFAYCTETDRGLCIPKRLAWTIPVRAGGEASRITIR